MLKLTLAEYEAVHPDYRSIWTTERTDWNNWEDQRHLYMGKRTLMVAGSLLVEGLSFEIEESQNRK